VETRGARAEGGARAEIEAGGGSGERLSCGCAPVQARACRGGGDNGGTDSGKGCGAAPPCKIPEPISVPSSGRIIESGKRAEASTKLP
jgi:hypothetical protein